MPVAPAGHRTHDRCARAPIAIDDRTDRGRAHERHIHQRDERRGDTGTIDDAQAGEDRSELALVEIGIDGESNHDVSPLEIGHDWLRLVSEHYDYIGDVGFANSR